MVKQAIEIFARIKPVKESASIYSINDDCASLDFEVPKDLRDGLINNKKDKYRFKFQRIFDQTCKQNDIFEKVGIPVADRVLAGYNGTIFAYGQTGSGKTFTITGGPEHYSDRGIIPRTLSYLYQHFSQDYSKVYTVHISYLEIYNEMGFDLLNPRQEVTKLEELPKVSIVEDGNQNIHLKNLSLHQSDNEEEALNLLFLGDTSRMIAETPMNQASTRSHCIFTIHLCSREAGSSTVHRSKLHLVDLAGSERVGKSGIGGQLLTEAKYINLSLHYLEQVIIALSEKNRSHVPYRNSLMTSVLRDSLGGNCMTSMIANVSLDVENICESISTCRFAQRVGLIKNEALINEELDPALLIVRLRKEIQSLKEEISIITGEERTGDITAEEIHRLQNQVKGFVDDPNVEARLEVGPDLRKIDYCFTFLKRMIHERPSSHNKSSGSADPGWPTCPEVTHSVSAELKKLKDMLCQRDNEISILVKMLKKEKRRGDAAAVQRTSPNLAMSPQASKGFLLSSVSSLSENKSGSENCEELLQQQKMPVREGQGSKYPVEHQQAFEVFRRQNRNQMAIDENKSLLRQRYSEAKSLGEQVNTSRWKVNDLKKQLEHRRRQVAVQGVTSTPISVAPDQLEEELLSQMEEEKMKYKKAFTSLKALKTKIEHLQLLQEKTRTKLQVEFNEWLSQQEDSKEEHSSLEVSSVVPGPTASASCLPMEEALQPHSNLHTSSITLLGDKDIDEDILAFIRARQNLLDRSITHT